MIAILIEPRVRRRRESIEAARGDGMTVMSEIDVVFIVIAVVATEEGNFRSDAFDTSFVVSQEISALTSHVVQSRVQRRRLLQAGRGTRRRLAAQQLLARV